MELMDLIKNIAMPSSTYPYFEGGKIIRVTLDISNKTQPFYNVQLHLKKYLPAEIFSLLKKQFLQTLKVAVHLSLEIEEYNLSPQLLQDYLTQYIELEENDHPQLQFMKQQQLVVRNKKVSIVFDSILKENLLNEKKESIESYFHAAGFDIEVQFVYVEKEDMDFNYEKDIQVVFHKYAQFKQEHPQEKQPTIKSNTKPTNQGSYHSNYPPIYSFKNKIFEKVQLDKIDSDIVDIDVECKVFDVVEDGINKKRFKLYVTNYKTSYIANIQVSKKYDASFIESLNQQWVQIKGTLIYNAYEKDNVISVFEIQTIDSQDEIVEDNAAEKRVELHAHTNMSAMDGIGEVEDLIQQAVKFNHSAIAITDHNSLQSFPNAQKAQAALAKKGKNIKIIYGLETNMVPKNLNIVQNPSSIDLKDATFVAFDIETTGLSCRFDQIIEFGAVKFKNNQEIETIDLLINPGFPLKPLTKKLTHIDDAMLKDKNTIEQELPKIKAFFADCIIIAHNATFDVGFLEQAFGHKITNPIIDTLPLSRVLDKDSSKHSLGAIARRQNIDYDEESAHRADYDAYVLKEVFDVMLSKLVNDQLATTHADLQYLSSKEAIKRAKPYHINFLVKNKIGLKNLFKLISIANTTYFTESSLVPRNVIEEYKEGLLIGSSCARGEIFEIASTKSEEELKKVMRFYDYIEIQPLDQYQILVDTEKIESMDRVIEILKAIIQAAKELNIPVVATGDAHYVTKNQAIAREILIDTPANGGGFHPLHDYQKRIFQYPIQELKTTQQMLDSFPYLSSEDVYTYVVTNTQKIAEQIEDVKPIHDKLYPPSLKNSDEDLRRICYENAHKMYGDPLPEIVQNRLEKELNSIISNGYSVIYIIASKTVQKSNEDGFLVGSRGSVGSSFVATCAGITEVNPLRPHYRCPHCGYSDFTIDETKVKSGYDLPDMLCPICHQTMKGDGHNIPFETFLGFEGDKVPDIDLNFSGKYQERAHAYIRDLFGKDYVFRAGTISTAAFKTAYGFTKKYFEKKNKTITNAETVRLAKMIEGTKRTTGQHPGGLIVIPSDMEVYDFTPIQYPADDVSSDWLTTHFAFESIHDNVLKLDMLGHVDPTALRMLQNLTGVDPKTIPMNDKNVLQQFSGINAADSKELGAAGLPEFGTSLARRMLEETTPKNFSELIQICGLSHGTDVWFGNARDLIRNKTCELMNVIGCRDDIMVTMLEYGLEPFDAFSIMENVRKATKTLTTEQEKKMIDHHVPNWYIDSCKKIKYMFPKAHAVAYTMMSIRVAWYKYYKPLEYYATYFTTRCDTYDIATLIAGEKAVRQKYNEIQEKRARKEKLTTKEEALDIVFEIALEMFHRNIFFGNIDLEKSMDEDFVVDTDHNLIIPPFKTIDGLGMQAAKSIVEARKERPFVSKEDLIKRTKLNTTNIKFLESIGVLKMLNEMDQLTLF